MNKKILFVCIYILVLISVGLISFVSNNNSKTESKKVSGTVMKYDKNSVTIQDNKLGIYKFDLVSKDLSVGDRITIEYSGILDKNSSNQKCEVISYNIITETLNDNGTPVSFGEDGIFSDYYKLAYNKLETLTLDEKIGQLLLARYPDSNEIEALKNYYLSGFVFYEKDFKDKKESDVKEMINTLQNNSNIPLLTAVDEEGGKIVRVSSNSDLVEEKFKSSSELYDIGGFDKIKEDTLYKSRILYNLGLNLNLAPVVDITSNVGDYIYDRTFKHDTSLTETYAKTVIGASKGTGVSYTLKHFPGYASNKDTHSQSSTDTRSYDEISKKDIPPFKAGIDAGAEAVLVSHNIVVSIDDSNPTSLSASAHNILRNKLNFSGIIISDDISMDALNGIENVTVKAILAGNDLIITSDYEESFKAIKNAFQKGTISEEYINKLAFRVLAWKYYKLLMFDNQK